MLKEMKGDEVSEIDSDVRVYSKNQDQFSSWY